MYDKNIVNSLDIEHGYVMSFAGSHFCVSCAGILCKIIPDQKLRALSIQTAGNMPEITGNTHELRVDLRATMPHTLIDYSQVMIPTKPYPHVYRYL